MQPKRSDRRSILLSMLIHVALLVALALIWTTRVTGGGDEGPRRVSIVLAAAGDKTEYFDEADVAEQAQQQAAEASLPEALPTDQPPIDVSELVNQVTPLELPLPGISSSEMVKPQTATSDGSPIALTDAQKKQLAEEAAAFAASRPKGAPTTLQVFGSGQLNGRRFVFVLDRSKSMGSQGLNVLSAASTELTNAINNLEANHEFQILGYHHGTTSIERRSLLYATEENKKQVGRFISQLAAFGGTEHELALNVALSMSPDVVVLMTDGGLPEMNESQLRRVHRVAAGAQIHCIHFGSGPQRDPNNFMNELAGQNLGTYRYVDVSQWKR